MTSGWIGVDLDGTLAVYDGWKGIEHIGDPVKPMLWRVQRWLEAGKTVKIFTARAGTPEAVPFIKAWCVLHVGRELEVTDRKDYGMIELWDDRCVQVHPNTGVRVG